MKNLTLSLSLLFLFTCSLITFPSNCLGWQRSISQDSLSAYIGKYQIIQGTPITFVDVYIEKGKLTAKSSNGEVLILDHINGDNFKLTNKDLPVKFIRDENNKVFQISVNGSIAYTRVQNPTQATADKSFNPKDFLGIYQVTVNGQQLKIEVSLKNGQLWATQLWDNASSTLDFVSGDKFIVNALSMPLRFIRDNGNRVIQLLLNNRDLFTKIKN